MSWRLYGALCSVYYWYCNALAHWHDDCADETSRCRADRISALLADQLAVRLYLGQQIWKICIEYRCGWVGRTGRLRDSGKWCDEQDKARRNGAPLSSVKSFFGDTVCWVFEIFDHHLTTTVQSPLKMPKKPVVTTNNGLFLVLGAAVQNQQN